jgi:hypothetical protein
VGSVPAGFFRDPRSTNWDSFREDLESRLQHGPKAHVKDEAGLGLAIAFVQGALITAYEDNCPLKFGRKGKWSLRWTSKLESLRREIRRLKLKLKTVSQGFYFFGIRESNSARSDERR